MGEDRAFNSLICDTCMASGTSGDSDEDLNSRVRCRWSEYSKVYTRKLNKKAHKASNNNDIAATTTSISGNVTAAPTTSANVTSTRTEVSSTTVATVDAAEVSVASISEELNDCAAASPPPAANGSLSETTFPHTTGGGHVVPKSLETVVMKDAGSYQRLPEQSPHQEKSLPRGSPIKDEDSSPQRKLPQQLQEQQYHQEQLPLSLEDDYLTQNQVQEGSGSQTAELQNPEDLQLRNSSEAQNQKALSPIHSANELLETSGDKAQNLGERSLLSCENDHPNGREVAAFQMPTGNEVQNDGEQMRGLPHAPEGNAPLNADDVVKRLVISSVDDRIRINLCKETRRTDIKELRKKLEFELDQVRRLVEQLESKEFHLASNNTQVSNSNLSVSSNYLGPEGTNIGVYSHPQPVGRRVLVRLNSEVSAMGRQETRPPGLVRVNSDVGPSRNLESRQYSRQLSVAVTENNHRAGEFVEKEKRTPKANKYYRNSEFLLGKDRLPPENNKRLKTINGRKHSGETEHLFGFAFGKSRNHVFRTCGSLLQRLMKHKYGWVFNEPVDAKALGLIDYHDIIKHPMDLGTIKTRLAQNWYKYPGEFAEDVRLVFRNAMTYNPKGQDVHVMAEQLLLIFEEKWAVIETEYNSYWKYQMYQDGGLRTAPSRRVPPQSHFVRAAPVSASLPGFIPLARPASAYVPTSSSASAPLYASAALQMRTFDRPQPMAITMTVDPKIQRPRVTRTPAPKKPKAKDLNKRDMTYEEKQRLSTNLQGLPPEKLDSILQIIKKRNTALSQHDDEVEVDIDSVDPETLWELDRFVTNYKKSLSKNKRKAELAHQARMVATQNAVLMNSTPAVTKVPTESGGAMEKSTAPPAEGEQQGYNRGRSSSSNSSSSDTGSSSSDSDSESSSADGSDAGHSPKTQKDMI